MDAELKQRILQAYQDWNAELITQAQTKIEHVQHVDEMSAWDKRSAIRIMELKIALSKTTIQWIKDLKGELGL